MDYDISPKFFSEFKYHRDIVDRLKVNNDDKIINAIFVGLNNSGKKTLINAFINHIFDAPIHLQKKINFYDIKIGNNTVKVEYISSNYHFELNLYEFGYYDKNIITDFIQNIIKYKSINIGKLKIIIINHFDKISKQAQLALRRIVEKSMGSARFILCCESLSKVDPSILSRFQIIRVPRPNIAQTDKYIRDLLKKNKIKFTKKTIKSIQDRTNNDIYKINIELQYVIKNNSSRKKLIIKEESYIQPIIEQVYKKDLESIYVIRELVYKYLLINIKPKQILRDIVKIIIDKISCIDTKFKLLQIAAQTEHQMCIIHYNIVCLEFFILKVKKMLLT